MRKFLINQRGSVEDIRCALRYDFDLHFLTESLENEKQNQNRATVIKMLEVAIRKADKKGGSNA